MVLCWLLSECFFILSEFQAKNLQFRSIIVAIETRNGKRSFIMNFTTTHNNYHQVIIVCVSMGITLLIVVALLLRSSVLRAFLRFFLQYEHSICHTQM